MLENTERAITKLTIQRNWQDRVHNATQNKNTTQYALDTNIRKHAHITEIRNDSSNK